MPPDIEAFFIMAIFLLFLSLVMDVLSIYLMKLHKQKWYLLFPLFLWSIHLTIFYSSITYAHLMNSNLALIFHIKDAGEIWSVIQRLHGVITIFYMTYILHLEMKR